MKKTILAVLAGFTVAFVAGAHSTPAQAARPTEDWRVFCRTASDCVNYGQSVCPEDPVVCNGARTCVCA